MGSPGSRNHRGQPYQIMKQVNKIKLDHTKLDKIPPTFQPKNTLTTITSDFSSSPPLPQPLSSSTQMV